MRWGLKANGRGLFWEQGRRAIEWHGKMMKEQQIVPCSINVLKSTSLFTVTRWMVVVVVIAIQPNGRDV